MNLKNLKYLKYLLLAVVITFAACSDEDDPTLVGPEPVEVDPLAKKEMRGVWISTAWELDWPMGVHEMEAQKQQYIDYMDKLVELNFNTVFVQIKPMGDAFYNSPYEPWSSAITGTRGQDPGYDVLQFMIEETHKRGLEFHAWMNPYRIATRSVSSQAYPDLGPISAELVVDHEKIRIYNPALPEVQKRLADIVEDVITKYDVDGIHFDDYFYPDPTTAGKMVEDTMEFRVYGKGEYASLADFRRANVDKAIKGVYERIVAKKPEVVFSISPAASDAFNYGTLFADVNKWCKEGWVDVIIPQLYAHTQSTSNNFKERVHWWPQFSYKAVPVIGYALYKFGDVSTGAPFQDVSELQLQFDRAALEPKIKGSVMYRAKTLLDNPIGVVDKLAELYEKPAVMPFVGRKVDADPSPATGVALKGTTLSWGAASGVRSVVYCFEYKYDADGKQTGVADVATVVGITTDQSLTVSIRGEYVVTTLNKDNVESAISDRVAYK